MCGLAALCGRAAVITALSRCSKPLQTKHLAEWPYHLDPPLAEYSCKVHPCPVLTAFVGSPLPGLPLPGFSHWHRPGMLANCDRPSGSHYTQSKGRRQDGNTKKKTRQANNRWTTAFIQFYLYWKKGLLRNDWKEEMMTGGIHNWWRHIYWSAIRKPQNTLQYNNQPSLLRSHSNNPVSPHQWGPSTCHRLSSQFPIASDRDWRLLLDPRPGDENQTWVWGWFGLEGL